MVLVASDVDGLGPPSWSTDGNRLYYNQDGVLTEIAVQIGTEGMSVSAATTQGRISFHDWLGDGWAILFSHPK